MEDIVSKEKNKKNSNKNGIIFGKFYPLHIGHVDFIQKSSGFVDNLYVIVCTDNKRDLKLFEESKMKKMPTIKDRVRFVEQTFNEQKNIKILHLEEDGITEYPNGWKDWSDRVKELLLKNNIIIDIIFTNENQDVENYKENFKNDKYTFNRNLEIKTIDTSRSNFNISATEVRKNPYNNWFFIPRYVREFFVLKVLIIGSENSGKTNLTQKLANYYNTTYVKEYRKEYIREVLQNNVYNLQYDDYSQIVYRHNLEILNSLKTADKLLFIDTDFTSLQVFSILQTGSEHPIIEDFIKNIKFDIIIYVENTSMGEENKERFDVELKRLLKKHNKKYILIKNKIRESKYKLTETYNESIEIINKYISDN